MVTAYPLVGRKGDGLAVAAKLKIPRRRTLRRGDEGDDVLWLQTRLASFGYEVGEIDGRFGYLTEDALIEFQREHRLQVDGIAGSRVMAALVEEVPRKRVVHEIRAGERLSDLARTYGASVDAIRWMNRLSGRARLLPGKRLVLRSSHVLAGLPVGANAVVQRTLASQRNSISSIAAYGLVVEGDGSLVGDVDSAALALAKEESWPVVAAVLHEGEGGTGDLVGALTKRKRRRQFFGSLKERLDRREFEGLLLDIGQTSPGRGGGLVAGIAALKKEFPRLPLTVALSPPERGWRALVSDLDYRKVGGCVDRFLLPFHRWECLLDRQGETPHRDLVEGWVARTTRLIPPWKVLLGIPMGACRLAETPEEVGYRTAVAAALERRRRPKADENGYLTFCIDEGEGEGRYILAGRESFSRLITLAYRHRLAGLFLHPVGLEDRRLWEVVSRRLWVERA